ncbi:J domain-containing protein [Plasmodiophora brassicae]
MTATTFYDLLGVSKSDDLTADVLRKAYYKKALLVHPDKDPSPEAVARFQELSRAFEVLSDPDTRARYDLDGEGFDADDLQVDASSDEDRIMQVCRDLFEKAKPLDMDEIASAVKEARTNISGQDSNDLQRYYNQFDGQISKIMQCVNCKRSAAIAHLKSLIDDGVLKMTPAFQKTVGAPGRVPASKKRGSSSKKPKKTIAK